MEKCVILEELFFLWWEQCLWDLAIDSLLLTAPQYRVHRLHHSETSHWPISAPRSLSLQRYIFRGCHSPPRSSLKVFRTHCCKFFVEDQSLYKDTGPQAVPEVLSITATLVRTFCGRGANLSLVEDTLEIFSGCNNVQHRWALFLPWI